MQSAEQHSERMSGGLLGGYKEVSTSDSEVAEAANFAAEQLSQRSNSLYPFKVKEVRHKAGSLGLSCRDIQGCFVALFIHGKGRR